MNLSLNPTDGKLDADTGGKRTRPLLIATKNACMCVCVSLWDVWLSVCFHQNVYTSDTQTESVKAGRKKRNKVGLEERKAGGSVRNPSISFLSIQCKDSRHGNTAVPL